MGNYILFIAAIGSIYALLALGLNLIWGGTGMVNLGLAGFFAVGAYVSALVTTTGHLPIAAGWVLALIAGGIALIMGSAFAQHFHGCLHIPSPPAHIRAMRALGLLMSPAAHQLHHDTLQRDFATNCGWSNPLINKVFRLAYRRGWIREAGLVPTS